jgi:peptidoglycan/xylan/chitin deacetylase (PgdA/CDA1 family)/LysM repeat protein
MCAHRPLAAVTTLLLCLAACSTSAPAASPTAMGSSSAGSTATPPASFGSLAPTVPGETSPSPLPTTYTVVAGDTLYGIARRFGTSVAQLQAWNAAQYPSLATDPTSIRVAWVLIVAGDPGITPLPTASPVLPSSTPVVAACHAGDRPAPGSAQTLARVANAGPALALTFDMGGRLDPAVAILDFLMANRICATIFPTGAMSQTATGQQVLAIVRAHPELFEIGNHTMHHCDLVRGGGGSPTTAPCQTGGAPSADFIRSELTDAAAILKAATGQDPVPYWRPPYGSINSSVLAAAASVGYTKTILWDIDTIDWKPISDGGPTAQQIATKVIGQAVSGSIVLMHLGGYETLDALHLMVPALRERGFALTSISDLLDGP